MVVGNKLRLNLQWTTNYAETINQLLRKQYEIYGGDPVTFAIRIQNIGDRPFSGEIKDIRFDEKVASGGLNWTYDDKEISTLNTGQEIEVFRQTLVPYGEGLLWFNCGITSSDGTSVEIEGRKSSSFQYFLYVHNRLLLELLLRR